MSTTKPVVKQGRPPKVDRDMIVAAAIDVGFDHLSMPSVGRLLGVSHAALYTHVQNRSELVAAAIDGVFAAEQWPDPAEAAGWRSYLTDVAVQLWQLLGRHRGLAYALEETRRVRLPAGYAEFLRGVRGALVDFGFPPLDALIVVGILTDLAVAYYKGGRDEEGNSLSMALSRHRPDGDDADFQGVDDRTRDGLVALLGLPPRELFTHRLELLLDGASAMLGRE